MQLLPHGVHTLIFCSLLNLPSETFPVPFPVGCEGISDRAGILWHRLQGCFICCIFQPLIGDFDVLPEVLLILLQTSVMWAFHWRSEVILIPRYFSSVSMIRVWPWSWYYDGRTEWHRIMLTAVHLWGWKDIFKHCSQHARLLSLAVGPVGQWNICGSSCHLQRVHR